MSTAREARRGQSRTKASTTVLVKALLVKALLVKALLVKAALVTALLAQACADTDLKAISNALDAPTRIDFGGVPLSRTRETSITLRNTGTTTIRLETPRFEQPSDADFTVLLDHPEELVPGATLELTTGFAPAVLGRRAARLVIPTDSGVTPELRIELSGEGVLGDAALSPDALDFGDVAIQTASTRRLTLTNATPHTAEVALGAPSGDDGDFFRTMPSGIVIVPPQTTLDVDVLFLPMRLGPHSARIPVSRCPSCAPQEVVLSGNGIAATLIATPPVLDFGFMPPQQVARQTTRIENVGAAAVQILEVRLGSDSAPEFQLEPAGPLPPALATNQGFDLTVAFRPIDFDRKKGTLRVRYTEPSWAQPVELVVPIGGVGGGPDLEAVPNPLAYPRTALGLQVEKSVSLRNVGRDPNTPLVITGLEIRGSIEFEFKAAPQLPITIAPGRAVALPIHYTPLVAGSAEAQLVVTSNDPDESPATIRLLASASQLGPCTYEVVPQQLDFGTVAMGTTAQLAFGVRNIGTETCAVANVRMSRQTPAQFAMQNLSTRLIAPGETLLVPVQFTPDAARSFAGRAEFDVSSQAAPHAEVLLTATSDSSCLTVNPASLDFGTVGLACFPPRMSISIENGCAQIVSVAGCEVGTGASSAYSVDPAESGPRTLAPGQNAVVTVTYTPAAEGDDVAPLFVRSDATQAPLLVPMTGHATLRPTTTDRFTLPPLNMVDFLFVIDNSGSFTEEQDALSRNFDRFIRTAQANGTDYRVAITTTGLAPYRGGWADCPGGTFGGEAGRFFPTDNSRPRILTPQTPDVRGAFEQNVKVGICHWWEEGLEASRLALSPPLIDSVDAPATPEANDGNAGFLRPEASLYVLYISDEEDAGLVDPARYVEFLRSLKPGRPDLVSASAILGVPSCTTAPSVGTRYMQVVNAMGGMIADICSPDWGGLLERIGDDAFTPQATFPLSTEPDGRDLTVQRNGTDVPMTAADGSPNWHFDPSVGLHGAVVFEQNRLPGPADTVSITYAVPCPPPR